MCKSNSEPPEANLETDFNEIRFKVNDNDVICCKGNNWMYKLNKSLGMSRTFMSQANEEENNQENEENKENIKSLEKEIEEKNIRIKELNNKIKEIDEKIKTMNKILNIDVSEQDYVKDLSDKINSEKNQA